jgi:Uncharacterized protein conserved in bacteria (DUF2059)
MSMRRNQTFKIGIAAMLAISAPTAVYAQAEEAAVEIALEDEAGGSASQTSGEDAIMAMIGKIFDTDENAAPIDPVQLKLAETTAGKLLPNGSMKAMMTKMFETFVTPLMNAMPEMSSGEIMMKTGIYEGDVETLDDEKRKTITAMLDPTRKDRGKQVIEVITPLLDGTMALLEPPMRTGISRAYARKFSAEQLRQINGFFATPTGSAFAAESYPLQADPEVMRAMFKAMPELLKTLKTKGPSLDAEMKKLPKERTLSDLTDTEIAQLAKLLNVEPAKLEEQRLAMLAETAAAAVDAEVMSEDSSSAAIDGALAAVEEISDSPYADETGEEPWYDEANWAAADRKKTAAAFKKREKAEVASSAAYSIWADVFALGVSKSRDKYIAEGWKPAETSAADEAAMGAAEAAAAAVEAATETP